MRMRRMSLLIVTSIAAGTLAAQAPPTPVPSDEQPQLIHSVTINPGDSPLVQAAKKAMAARHAADQRIRIDERMTRGRGHVSQSTGPVTVSLNVPSSGNDGSSSTPATEVDATRQKVQAQVQALRQEQEMIAAEADEQYANDIEEDQVDQRQTQIPNEIQQLQPQQPPPAPPQ
jgi:hypothetical protein